MAVLISVYIKSNYNDVIIIPKSGIEKLNNLLLKLMQVCSKVELIPEQPDLSSFVTC